VVAEELGVDPEILVPETSLVDDLAADSLDLIELGLALEGELGVSISERQLQDVRTYADLLGAVASGRRGPLRVDPTAIFVRARVVPGQAGAATMERAGELDPYTVEILVDEVLRAGPGARLEVEVRGDQETGAAARRRFGQLLARGVEVSVWPEGQEPRPAA